MEDLSNTIAEAIMDLLREQGFEVPLYVTSIGANGSAFVFHYRWANPEHPEEGLDADVVAEHVVGGGFIFPINFLFVDATGERAGRLVINGKGTQWFH